jgi:hypothetical protein
MSNPPPFLIGLLTKEVDMSTPKELPEFSKTIEKLMYALVKNAARSSWSEFLEDWDIDEREYEKFKLAMVQHFGADPKKFYF